MYRFVYYLYILDAQKSATFAFYFCLNLVGQWRGQKFLSLLHFINNFLPFLRSTSPLDAERLKEKESTVFSPIDGPPIGVSRTFTSYGLRNRFFVFFIKYFCVSRQELQNKWSVRFLGPGNAEKHHFGDLELMSKLDYATLL